MNENETVRATVAMRATDDRRRGFYGVLFESITTHAIAGRGVHNNGSQHKLEVWISKRSRRTDDLARTSEPVYRSPEGEICGRNEMFFFTSAQATMIASTPVDRPARGEALRVGDVVELEGFGLFRITARMLRDPGLTPVD
jgi:hypothetical protein